MKREPRTRKRAIQFAPSSRRLGRPLLYARYVCPPPPPLPPLLVKRTRRLAPSISAGVPRLWCAYHTRWRPPPPCCSWALLLFEHASCLGAGAAIVAELTRGGESLFCCETKLVRFGNWPGRAGRGELSGGASVVTTRPAARLMPLDACLATAYTHTHTHTPTRSFGPFRVGAAVGPTQGLLVGPASLTQ